MKLIATLVAAVSLMFNPRPSRTPREPVRFACQPAPQWCLAADGTCAAPLPPCAVTEADLNHTAGPEDPACSGPHPSGIGRVWGYHCGTTLQTRWWVNNGCVIAVVP